MPPWGVWSPRLREPGGRFYPPLGGASRAFGLPRAAAKRLFAGKSPHPLFSSKSKNRKKNLKAASITISCLSVFDMQIQRKSTFSLCINPQPISALFGRIRCCVPQAEARWHPCSSNRHSASCRGCAAKPPHDPAQRWRDGEKMRRSEGESELLRRSKRCRPGAYGARADENRGDENCAG